MLHNYVKIAWRNIMKSKGFSLINIVGLATGMAVALIIGLWVQYEYSYDRFLDGNENLYQVMMNYTEQGKKITYRATSLPLSDAIADVPGIERVVVSDWMGPHNLTVEDKVLIMDGAQIGSDFLTMFSYPMIIGDVKTCLQESQSIVLTKSTATALFGQEDPMGKVVRFDATNDLKVTGI
ncbi:MAG: ABC transporter permease, partial [Cyclobacteriaceae bacterium]